MIFTTAPYATAAETLILALDSIADRFSPEHDAVLETLSILSTVRDADSFDRPLVGYGERGFVASTGVSIAVFDTLEDARAYIGRAEHRFPRGRAIVEVDRVDGDDPLFTDHALEAPRLEPVGPALEIDEVFDADDPEIDELLRPGYVDDERELAAAELKRRENVLERVIRENVAAADRFIAAAAPAGPRRFETEEQVERARNLAAYGPLTRKAIDDELDALGWTERYDGDDDATDLKANAAATLYDRRGRIADGYAPLAETPEDDGVDFDPLELEGAVETVTAPVADPAELEGLEAEIYARAIAAGIPADQLFAFEGEIWHRGAPLFLDDLPPLPPAPAVRDRTHERADLALERLTDLGHADLAVRILRSWDAGRLTAAEALEQANAAEREIAWQRIRSRSGARSRPAPR